MNNKIWDSLESVWNSMNKILEKEKYYTFEEIINIIDEPNRTSCKNIYTDNKEIFEKAKWSTLKHQSWEWWYLDHIMEISNIAIKLYKTLSIWNRKFDFTLSDALLTLFLHDLEKPWKYAWNEKQKKELESFPDYKDFIKSKVKQYWFLLTDEHLNALKYVHWEWDDYDPNLRVQWPLWAFIHICDTISARIWFNFPEDKDNW